MLGSDRDLRKKKKRNHRIYSHITDWYVFFCKTTFLDLVNHCNIAIDLLHSIPIPIGTGKCMW